MEIDARIDLINGAYHVQVGLTSSGTPLTPEEASAFQKFGEPLVQIGGTFTQGELTFTLPADERRLPSQFPVKQVFAIVDHEDADARAAVFNTTIQTRMAAARTSIMNMTPGATGHFITTV